MLEVDALDRASAVKELRCMSRIRSNCHWPSSCHAMTSRRGGSHTIICPSRTRSHRRRAGSSGRRLRSMIAVLEAASDSLWLRATRVESCVTREGGSALVSPLIVLRTGVFVVSATLVTIVSSAAVLEGASAWVQNRSK